MTDPVEHPKDADAAIARIEDLLREIQILSDEFGLDPSEWLQNNALEDA